MDISLRLRTIADLVVERCNTLADIGTDHAYIPIYLIKKDICKKVIASDINSGPVKKARLNISLEGLSKSIECRLGSGLTTIKPKEVQVAIIAGMGGQLIKDIIEESIDVFKNLDYAILQPVQNPEVLREHLYKKGYNIIQEDLCYDEGKYYEIIKVAYDKIEKQADNMDPIYYEVSHLLLKNNHPLIEKYIKYKIDHYEKIMSYINADTTLSIERKEELSVKIKKLKEMLGCL